MPAGRGLESRGHEEEVHMDIYMAHTFVETGVATGPSPGTNVEVLNSRTLLSAPPWCNTAQALVARGKGRIWASSRDRARITAQ